MITKLVFSGGGMKSLSFIGAIDFLSKHHYFDYGNLNEFIGSSAGSIVAGMLYVGYTAEEFLDVLLNVEIDQLKRLNIRNLVDKYGLDDGIVMERMFEHFIEKKTEKEMITFKEAYDIYNRKLVITATNLNKFISEHFDYITTPDMPISKAIRISISLPPFFTPVRYQGCLYSDGSILDPYPTHFIANEDKANIIGITTSDDIEEEMEINSLGDYAYSLLLCGNIRDKMKALEGFEDRTVMVTTEKIDYMDYNLNEKNKRYLYQMGFESAEKFYNQELKCRRTKYLMQKYFNLWKKKLKSSI